MRDRRDWRGVLRDGRFQGLRAFGWGLLLIVAVFGLAALAAAGLSKAGVPKEGAGELLRIGIITAVLFGAYSLMVRLGERRSVTELALRPALPELTAGLGGGIAAFSLVMCILLAMHGYTIAGPHLSSPLRPLALSISSGIEEELIFQGIFVRLIWEAFGLRVALVSSAVLFGLAPSRQSRPRCDRSAFHHHRGGDWPQRSLRADGPPVGLHRCPCGLEFRAGFSLWCGGLGYRFPRPFLAGRP